MASNREESDSSTDSTYVPDDDIPARRALFREEEGEIDAIHPEIDSSEDLPLFFNQLFPPQGPVLDVEEEAEIDARIPEIDSSDNSGDLPDLNVRYSSSASDSVGDDVDPYQVDVHTGLQRQQIASSVIQAIQSAGPSTGLCSQRGRARKRRKITYSSTSSMTSSGSSSSFHGVPKAPYNTSASSSEPERALKRRKDTSSSTTSGGSGSSSHGVPKDPYNTPASSPESHSIMDPQSSNSEPSD